MHQKCVQKNIASNLVTSCRLYQTFLIESQERIKAKPPASKASQSKPASAREAGLRAAITAPLSANVALDTGQSILQLRLTALFQTTYQLLVEMDDKIVWTCQLSRLKPDITHFLQEDSKAKNVSLFKTRCMCSLQGQASIFKQQMT